MPPPRVRPVPLPFGPAPEAPGEAPEPLPPVRLLADYRPAFVRRPDWRYLLLTGGRGSAKSFHVAVLLVNLTYEPGHVILFTRYTMASAEVSIIPEFVEKITLLGLGADFYVTKSEIVNRRTGSRILFRGIKTSSGNQTAALKSIQGVTTWVLDEAEELHDEDTFDRIDLSIRSKLHPNRVVLVLNPSTTDHFVYRRFLASGAPPADTLVIHTTWEANRHNLSASWIANAEKIRDTHPERYRHLFLGEWRRPGAGGLLWTEAHILRARLRVPPVEEYDRVLVGVDPAMTSRPESNETGLIVAGANGRGDAYILEDLSGRYTPNQWAAIAVGAAQRWQGSIIAEVNQGGDLVRTTIAAIAPSVRVLDAHASRGKYARAEPVFALYEAGRIFHVGEFPVLERQMLDFNPTDKDTDSPDRVDALVWTIDGLLIHPPSRAWMA